MATDTVLNELILQEVTQAEFEQLGKDNLLDENRIYLTPDNSLKGTLLDFKWADHILNDMSWLRADTFSWHSGDIYLAVRNHLEKDLADAVEETVTIDGIEIKYYLAKDKHRICLPDQEDALLDLYNKTGVAWYYILDTENKQFKLPRSKHNKYADTVPVVGNGMALGITTGSLDRALGSAVVHDSATVNALMVSNNDPEGIKVGGSVGVPNQGNSLGTGIAYGVSTTPEKSGLIAPQEQDTDQYKYLYFYVGCFDKEGLEQTAGITAEMFNSKADVDLGNMNASQSAKDTIVGWSVPDYSAGVDIAWTKETLKITDKAGAVHNSEAYYIAPADGMVVIYAAVSNGSEHVFVNKNVVENPGTNVYVNARFPVSKGDEIRVVAVSRYRNCQFFPLKGVN